MEEKPTDHIEVSHHHPNCNYASSTEDTIAHEDNFGRNGTYGETNVNQVNVQGKITLPFAYHQKYSHFDRRQKRVSDIEARAQSNES